MKSRIVFLFVLLSVCSLGSSLLDPKLLHRVRLHSVNSDEDHSGKVKQVLHETEKCDALCEASYAKTDEHHGVCVRGCHYYMLQWQISNETDPNLKFNSSNRACHKSCEDGFTEPELIVHCDTGCGHGAKHVSGNIPKTQPMVSSTDATPSSKKLGDSFPNPNEVMIDRIINNFEMMRQRSRLFSEVPKNLPPLPVIGTEETEKEGETDKTKSQADPVPVVFSRSVSIIMTTDEDGNRRVVVINRPPVVRFGSSMLDNNQEDKASEPGEKSRNRYRKLAGEDFLRTFLSQHPESSGQKLAEANESVENYSAETGGWTTHMVDFTARTIFVVMLIMTLYLVFIVCLALRHRRERMLRGSPSMAATLASGQASIPLDRPPPKYKAQNSEGDLKSIFKKLPLYSVRTQRPPSYSQVNSKAQTGLLPTMGKPDQEMP